MRNDLNQLTNLKSLSFTWKIIANLVGVFPQVVLCHRDFRDFFDTHISSVVRFVVDRVEKLKLFVSVVNPDDSPAPTLRSSLLSPLLPPPLVLRSSLLNSCGTNGCWFHPSALLYHAHQIYKVLHDFFWSILTIHDSRVTTFVAARF